MKRKADDIEVPGMQKTEGDVEQSKRASGDNVSTDVAHIQFVSETGDLTGDPLELSADTTSQELQEICFGLVEPDEQGPYKFYVNDVPITKSLREQVTKKILQESLIIEVVYKQQAVFRVWAVTRLTSTLKIGPPVISSQFSPTGKELAIGAGDKSVRFYDLDSEMPLHYKEVHKHWVLCLAWSSNGQKLASADKNGEIIIWNPKTGEPIGKPLGGFTGHKNYVTSLCWEPFHLNPECRLLASSSADNTVKVWDVLLRQVVLTVSHDNIATCVKWGGTGLLYTSSRDKTIKVWAVSHDAGMGKLCRTLKQHAHWVNTIALSTDYVLRTGSFDPKEATLTTEENTESREALRERAQQRYEKVKGTGHERLVSASEDHTLTLWHPEDSQKPIAHMTGHKSLVIDVKFSPDTRIIASASWDKSVKLWDGYSGKFIATLFGHVEKVFMLAWAADSRLLASASKDSSLKIWSIEQKKLLHNLTKHQDAVYTVDWSPDSQRVVTGSKDGCINFWRR